MNESQTLDHTSEVDLFTIEFLYGLIFNVYFFFKGMNFGSSHDLENVFLVISNFRN